MMIDALPVSTSSSSILCVRPTAMTHASHQALRQLQREFFHADWEYETLKDSALGEWIWTKGDAKVTLVGWHGTTWSYGTAMVFWEVSESVSGELQARYDATGYPVGGSGLPCICGDRGRLFAAEDSAHYLTQILPAVLAAARAALAR